MPKEPAKPRKQYVAADPAVAYSGLDRIKDALKEFRRRNIESNSRGMDALTKFSGRTPEDDQAAIEMMSNFVSPLNTVSGKAAKVLLAKATKKGRVAIPSFRDVSPAEAMDAFRSGRHLIQDATGQYVGAPRGIDTPEKLAQMRALFDAQVENGHVGGNWYDEAQAFVKEIAGDDPVRQLRLAQELGITSAQATPPVNAGFAFQGHNAIEAGRPRKVVRTGAQARKMERVAKGLDAGGDNPKISVYSSKLVPILNALRNKLLSHVPTNDIWHFRAFGYKRPDGKMWSSGGTKQMHAFVDAETALAADRANAKALGGRTDWNAESIQAAPWVYGKGKALHEANPKRYPTLADGLAEAKKGYADVLKNNVAYNPHESIPTDIGHLTGLQKAPLQEREMLTNSGLSSTTSPSGHDAAAQALEIYGRPSIEGTGDFKGTTNPSVVSRLMVALTGKQGHKTVDKESMQLLKALGGYKGFIDNQAAYAVGKPVFGNTMARSTAIHVPLARKVSQAEMAGLKKVADKHGYAIVDSGEGVTMVPFDPANPPMDGRTLKKMLANGDQKAGVEPIAVTIKNAIPDAGNVSQVEWSGAYEKMHTAKKSQFGKGVATRRLQKLLTPKQVERLDNDPLVVAQRNDRQARDVQAEGKYGPRRPDIALTQQILAQHGLKGLFEAAAKGAPVAGIAGISAVGGMSQGEGARDR